jgi:hypothetical protein
MREREGWILVAHEAQPLKAFSLQSIYLRSLEGGGWRRQFHERLARRARKAQLEKVEEKAAAYPARATGTRWVRSALIFPVAIACTC